MRSLVVAVSGVAAVFVGCSSSSTSVEVVPKPPVASVSLTLPSPTLLTGQTQQAVATPRDATGAALMDRTVTWQSANTAVASVNASGTISAVAPGTDVITASSEGVSAQGTLTVMPVPPVPVATVSVSPVSPTLQVGGTVQLTAVTRDANGSVLSGRLITWTSTNTAIVTVSSSGLVSALSAGTAGVIASSEGQTATSSITVTAIPVASVTVTPATSNLQPGGTARLSALTRDANNNVLTGRVVTWASASTGVATVNSSGLVSAVAAGTTNITATSEGHSGSASVTVAQVPVASVTVTLASGTVGVGSTTQATATLRDANNNLLTGRTVTWASGNTAFATVSGSGVVTGVAAGTTSITATSGGVSGSANVTVTTGSSPIVFSDDFESGTMSKWNESDASVQQVVNDPASAHSGNRFLRLTFGINGGDAAWLNKYFNQGYTQVYVRYYVRFANNFAGGTKMVGFHGAPIGNPSAGVGRAGICPNGTDSFAAMITQDYTDSQRQTKFYTYWQDMWADADGRCWGRFGPTPSTFPYISPMPALTKGVWHKVEFTVKMNSAANVADGEQRFWVDGVQYGDWTGIRFGDPTRINIGVLIISGSGTTTQIQTVDYDDLILTTDHPSQSQP